MGAKWVRVLTVLAVAVLAACVTGAVLTKRAFESVDGDSIAEGVAKDQAERLNTRLGHRDRLRDAESIAATEVVEPMNLTAPPTTQVAVLAWSGRVWADERATIDVRFTVTTTEDGPFGHTAGSASLCFRYTLQLYRYTEHKEIRCPDIADPPVPSAAPVLRLPDDAAARLDTALRSASPETLEKAVRAAFPQEGIFVDTLTTGNTLVAAVGVPAERDCVVMIRTADKATKQVAFDREQLEPGETGCNTALYTHPAR